MAYTKTTWAARLREFTNRVQLTLVSGTTYDVTQVEGTVTQAGTAYSPDNMNKLEEGVRVANLAASETVVGLVELATPAETTTGSDTTKAVHPAGLKVELDKKINHSLATAVNDFLVATGVGVFAKKTLAEVKTILGLGTAAYTASTAYATAAQGVKADSYTASDVLTKIKTVDGAGSGLDADTLDGLRGVDFVRESNLIDDISDGGKLYAVTTTLNRLVYENNTEVATNSITYVTAKTYIFTRRGDKKSAQINFEMYKNYSGAFGYYKILINGSTVVAENSNVVGAYTWINQTIDLTGYSIGTSLTVELQYRISNSSYYIYVRGFNIKTNELIDIVKM